MPDRRAAREPSPVVAVEYEGTGSREGVVVKRRVLAAAVVPAAIVLAFAGCGVFESSGPEGGVSPFVSDFRVSPVSVPCDRDFVLSFRYSDPQGDIEFLRVTYQNEGGFTFEEEVLWEQGGGLFGLEDLGLTDEELEALEEPGLLDLSVPERATYTTRFGCDSGKPRGTYTVTVVLVDDNGHESSPRSDTIRLTTS